MHLRGHPNILKRVLVQVCGFNLGLLMRQLTGVGTPRTSASCCSSGTGRLSLGRRERPVVRGAPPGGVPGRRGRPDRGLSVAELCDLRRPLTRDRPATRKPDGLYL